MIVLVLEQNLFERYLNLYDAVKWNAERKEEFDMLAQKNNTLRVRMNGCG